jgi:hypothetical protein
MKRLMAVLSAFLLVGFFVLSCGKKAPAKTDYTVEAVPLSQVDITDTFWAPKQEANRTVSIQHSFDRGEEKGRGGATQLYEAAAYMIMKKRDPIFEAYIKGKVDALLARQAAAAAASAAPPTGGQPQRPTPNPAMRAGGTSAEAAIAYFEATGDRRLLDNAIKAADLAVETFGPGKKPYISGHEGQKIGLIRLFRFTDVPKYWNLAKYLLDIRGREEFQSQTAGEYPGDREYSQNHKPVLEQTEAVGHAVRAMYLYIPLTDIAALTGLPEYAKAADTIWEDVVGRKMYITGGVGSIRQQEKFGAAYELPNVSAWHETCASYGNVVWNHRLFMLHRDAKYIDTMERILYNGFAAGVSMKGDRFFYQNVLMSYGNYERFDWINVPCCPPNVVRLMAQLGSYIYAKTDNEIYVNLFVDSKAGVKLAKTMVNLTQATKYPWDGSVKMTVDPAEAGKFTVYVRIPEWAQGRPLPSDLYTYLDTAAEKPVLKVNGDPVEIKLDKGYVALSRRWKAGDVVELSLPMPVHKAVAHPNVRDDKGRIALERGPLVYCAEWQDNGGKALNIIVPDNASLKGEFRADLLNGVGVISGEVQAIERDVDGTTVKTVPHNLVAIPYYAWANRGMGEMAVWIARDAATAYLKPVMPAPLAKVTAFAGIEKSWTGYGDQNDELYAVYDGAEPLSSADESHLYYRMRPPQGKPAWVEYAFKAPVEVSSAEAYFVDDQRFCRLPASWRIVYKEGNTWKPVEVNEAYTVNKNAFNKVTFKPVKTTALRLEVEPQSILYKGGAAGPPAAVTIREDTNWREFGIIEWRVK